MSIDDRILHQRELRSAAARSLRQAHDVQAAKPSLRRVLRKFRARTRHFLRHRKSKLQDLIKVKHDREKARKKGGDKAVAWAVKQRGKAETPPSSNNGAFVSALWRFIGYIYPVPWCGCFAGYAAIKFGGAITPTRISWGYGPAIITQARAHQNGFTAVSFDDAQPGDCAVLWGGEHVVLVRGRPTGDILPTVEGNTSAEDGSQADGGCVALKTRSRSDVTVIARPDY